MVVQRFTGRIKEGMWDEAIEILKEMNRLVPFLPGRVYSSNYGPWNTVVWENEAENVAEVERLWEKAFAVEGWTSLWARWIEVSTGEGKSELWTLEGVRTGT